MSVTRGGKRKRPPFIAKLNEILEKADNFNYLFALLKLQCKHNVLIFVRKIGKDTFLRQTWNQSMPEACVEV